MTIKYVYVASPYTLGDVGENVRANIDAAEKLANADYVPFVPLLSHFWHMIHWHDYQFWIDQTMAWLEKCDAVVRLPGISQGADAEVERAKELGIPVFSLEGLLPITAL